MKPTRRLKRDKLFDLVHCVKIYQEFWAILLMTIHNKLLSESNLSHLILFIWHHWILFSSTT